MLVLYGRVESDDRLRQRCQPESRAHVGTRARAHGSAALGRERPPARQLVTESFILGPVGQDCFGLLVASKLEIMIDFHGKKTCARVRSRWMARCCLFATVGSGLPEMYLAPFRRFTHASDRRGLRPDGAYPAGQGATEVPAAPGGLPSRILVRAGDRSRANAAKLQQLNTWMEALPQLTGCWRLHRCNWSKYHNDMESRDFVTRLLPKYSRSTGLSRRHASSYPLDPVPPWSSSNAAS